MSVGRKAVKVRFDLIHMCHSNQTEKEGVREGERGNKTSATTLSIMTQSIKTFSITALIKNNTA